MQPFGGSPRQALYGVVDGHGEHGEQVAEFCTRAVVAALERAVAADAGAAACEAALAAAFRGGRRGARGLGRRVDLLGGTTAVVVVRLSGTLVCGNAGDSRAVVVRRAGAGFEAAPLSRDHSPDLPDERRRRRPPGPGRPWPGGPPAAENRGARRLARRARRRRRAGHVRGLEGGLDARGRRERR